MFGKVSSDDTVFAKLLSENYPVKLRQQIVDYIDNSRCTRKMFSDRSGITVASLGRWHKEESCRIDLKTIQPKPHVEPTEEDIIEETATIKVDGIEIEVPIKHIGKILKQLKE